MHVSHEALYKELGEFQRFMLRWREGLFQGFLLVLGALTVGLYAVWHDNSPEVKRFAWVIPLAGAFVAVIFSLIDRRCHEILRRNYDLGAEYEEVVGIYRASKGEPARISHTAVLQTLYIASGSALLILFLILIFGAVEKDFNMVTDLLYIVAIHNLVTFAFLLSFGMLGAVLGFKLIVLNFRKLGSFIVVLFLVAVIAILIMVPQTWPTISERLSQVWTTARLDDQALRIIEKTSRGEAITISERSILDLWLKRVQSNLPDDRPSQKSTEKVRNVK